MSVRERGRASMDAALKALPGRLAANVLRGGLRVGAKVIADRAGELTHDRELAATSIKVSTSTRGGVVTAKVQIKGPHAYRGPWGEFGTDPHFIAVADEQRQGMTVRRINDQEKKGVLVIGGNFIAGTVHHPGARPYPFLRPAFDEKQDEALAAAGQYVHARIAKGDINTPYRATADDE
ncbi:HK97 gp10 family phage protein [Sphingomonas sp. ID0503]|uniref:HK97 gp10 family phage protein n=1 Tax=Sphingomonas sp. ID0503 TaxID=3399691 RepID=UPI003AFB58C2